VRASRSPTRAVRSTRPRRNRKDGMIKRSLVLALLFSFALPALGYIEAMNSLKGVFQESDVIARATIDAVNAEKKVVIVKVAKSLKGKSAYEKIRIDLSAGPEWHGDMVLRHATV